MPRRFVVDMLPALGGDCLWVEWGDDDTGEAGRILIDGGMGSQKELNPRLRAAFRRRPGQHRFDLIVNTHMDADHITGITGLLRDPPEDFEVDEVWFNGLGQVPADMLDDVLSIGESDTLEKVLQVWKTERGIRWNDTDSIAIDGAVYVPDIDPGEGEADPLPTKTIAGLTITLLSPTAAKLTEMAGRWDEDRIIAERAARAAEEEEEGEEEEEEEEAESTDATVITAIGSSAPAGLTDADLDIEDEIPFDDDEDDDTLGFNADTGVKPSILATLDYESDDSTANGSSIAFIAEYAGKRVLLTGDAHAEVLCETLRRFQAEGPIHFDAVKLSHHGSEKNLSPELLTMLDCPNWLVSSNGKAHHHPDRRAMARLITREGVPTTLVFNYASAMNAEWADEDVIEDHNHTAYRPPSDKPADSGARFDMITGQAGPLPPGP